MFDKWMLLLIVALFTVIPTEAGISEADEREAATLAFQESDKLLNLAYKKAMSVLSEGEQKELRQAQKKWIVLRDAEADRESASLKGTNMYNRSRDDTLRELTIRRYAELLNIYYANYAVALHKKRMSEER